MQKIIQALIFVSFLFTTSISLVSTVHANTLDFSGTISSPGCVSSVQINQVTVACGDNPATPHNIILRNRDEKKSRIEGVLISINSLNEDRLKKTVSIDYF